MARKRRKMSSINSENSGRKVKGGCHGSDTMLRSMVAERKKG